MAIAAPTRVPLPQRWGAPGSGCKFAPFQQLPCRPARRPCRALAVSSAATVRSASVEQLAAWVGTKGGEGLSTCSISPAGLVAGKAVSKGAAVYSIPEACWLTPEVVAASELGPHVGGLPGWLQLALFLLHERSKAGSQWVAYIASLPEEPSSPVVWSDAELAELAGSQLLGLVQGYRDFFRSKFEELQGSVFAAAPALFPASAFSFEAFLWAVCSVRERVHAPLDGDKVALVPFADLTQHSRSASSRWQVKSSGVFGRTYSLVLEAGEEIEAGEAVGMDYGPGRSDIQVLLDYGRMDTANPQPGFALTLELPESDRFFGDKIDILEQEGLGESMEFTLRPSEPPSDTLLAVLRLLNLGGADAFLLESIFRNDVWGHLQLPVSEENERTAYQVMIDGCAAALRGYRTTIDEDLALLRGGSLAPRQELAVRARLGEKEALDATLRYFEDRITRLSGMEYYAERRLKRLGLLDDQGNTTWDGFFKDGMA